MARSVTDYARQRESRRFQNVFFMGGFVVFIGIGCSLALHGPARVVAVLILVAALATNVLSMARRVEPSELTPLTRRIQPGVWPATVRGLSLPEVAHGKTKITDFAEVGGRVLFTTGGVVWEPSKQIARNLGATTHTWDNEWQIQARRLRGLGNQAQIKLKSPTAQEPITLWMRRAGQFEIE
jgi:hypothetical protein